MNTAPISFGRAIKVNATPEVASEIAKAANVKQPSTELQRFAKTIFNDTDVHRAKVVVLEPNEVYIFSGEEAKKQAYLSEEMKRKVKANDDLVKMLPLREVREKRQHQADVENYNIMYSTIYRIRSLVENGINCRPKSSLDINSTIIKNQFFGDYIEILDAKYTSKTDKKREIFEYHA